jgi:hypothetical protein
MAEISIRLVQNKKDKLDFLRVPFKIYEGDKNWVAPLFLERLDHLNEKRNPYFQHAKAQLFIAERDGVAVGRISAQIDQLHLDRYHDACGQFGFLDAVDDSAVFAALTKTAGDWLRARGMKTMRGPFSFSINDEAGLLIDGFDTPPMIFMGHGRPYYDARMKQQGLSKAKDMMAYHLPRGNGFAPSLKKIYERSMASGDITLRPVNKSKIKEDIDVVMSIFNDAWSDNWGFIPFTQAELAMLATNFKMLLHKDMTSIAYYKGEPAAFCISLPNLNEWIAGMNGSILPFGWAKLVGKLISKKSLTCRVPLMGVRKKYQDSALGAALAICSIRGPFEFHFSRGGNLGELSWVLEDNHAMRKLAEAHGAFVYKTYRVYEQQL